MNCKTVFLILVALGFATPSAASDWSTYQGNNQRWGSSSETLQLPLQLHWEYSAPAAPETAWSGPRSEPIEGKVMRHRVAYDESIGVVSAGGRAYFGSSVDNLLYCVDAKTGQTLWRFPTDGPIRLAPSLYQGKVYAGSDDGNVYCLQADDGSLVWKRRAAARDERILARGRMISRWPVRTGVLVQDDTAYFGAGVFPHETVYLLAVNANTGDVVWRNDSISQEDAGRNDLSPQGYLLADNDYLFIPSGRSLPAAFDRKTGKQIHKRTHSWRTTAGGVVGGYKALAADDQIYTGGPHHFLAMNQKNGAVGFAWIDGRQLVVSGDKAFAATGEHIIAMDRLQHAEATQKRQEQNMLLYALNRKRRELDAAQFKKQAQAMQKEIDRLSEVGVLWKAPHSGDAALIALDNLVIIGGDNQVAAFNTEDGKQVWSAEVEGKASELAAAGGGLFVSTDHGKIYAFFDKTVERTTSEPAQFPTVDVKKPFPQDEFAAIYEAAAEEILNRSGVERGYALVVGAERGRLAYELARRTELKVLAIEPDAKKAAAAREALLQAGLYGHRVTVVHGDPSAMPFSNYFANLIVSDTLLLTGKTPGDPLQTARRLKPCGGVLCLGAPASSPARRRGMSAKTLSAFLAQTGIADQGKSDVDDQWLVFVRDKLPGAGSWSHQYGDIANTMTSRDSRVKGSLSVLWYGDPGPAPMINRHDAAAAPLSTNGRMFVQGMDSIQCFDAYNGTYLWQYNNPGALRTGVFNNEEASNLAASDDALFVAVNKTCTMLDAVTGKVRAVFETPASKDLVPRTWGYVGYSDGKLIGTSTIRKELERSLRRRGHTVDNKTDGVFAFDAKTGKRLWTYHGRNIMHVTIAIDGGRMFFIESSITKEQRESLLRQDKTSLKDLPPAEAKKKEAELKKLDVRLAVALDAETGEKLWAKPVDVTDCARVGIGGGQLTLMAQQGHVLICGANANGHYWRQFLSGQFKERRLIVLDAKTGDKLWAKDANYRHRPIIVGKEIYAEPWAFDLHTGKPKMRRHPLTGKETVWQFSRPGHHCGPLTATPNTLFFRSGYTGYYDLQTDSGARHFAGHRTGCWVNVIPGNGLVMIPEASAGCVCQFSIASTVVLEPRTDRPQKPGWGIYSAQGAQTPVRHLSINLGAPGDRRDANNQLWLAYPRPKTVGRLEYVFDISSKLSSGGGYYTHNDESLTIANTPSPWLYTSGVRGLTRCEIPLLSKDDAPAVYTITLHFAELNTNLTPGAASFTVLLQNQPAVKNFDILEETKTSHRAFTKTIPGVKVKDNLILEIKPDGDKLAALTAIEIHQEE